MKTSERALLGMASVLLLMAVGCARPTSLGPDYGLAYRAARHNQILNPQASANLEPVAKLDGQAAAFVMRRYRKRFEAPKEFVPTVTLPSLIAGVSTD